MLLPAKLPPGWLFEDVLSSAQMNFIQTQYLHALDGYGGGTYNLTAPLLVLDDLITFDDLFINNNLDVIGNVVSDALLTNAIVASTLTLSSDGYVGGSLNVNGLIFLSGSSGDVLCSDIFADTIESANLTVNAVANFNDVNINNFATLLDVFIGGDTEIGSSSSDDLIINANISSAVTFSGTGRVTEKVISAPNSDASINITTYKNIYLSASLTGPHTYTITGTPVTGDFFYIFSNDAATHTFTGLITKTVVSGEAYKLMYDGSSWISFQWIP